MGRWHRGDVLCKDSDIFYHQEGCSTSHCRTHLGANLYFFFPSPSASRHLALFLLFLFLLTPFHHFLLFMISPQSSQSSLISKHSHHPVSPFFNLFLKSRYFLLNFYYIWYFLILVGITWYFWYFVVTFWSLLVFSGNFSSKGQQIR